MFESMLRPMQGRRVILMIALLVAALPAIGGAVADASVAGARWIGPPASPVLVAPGDGTRVDRTTPEFAWADGGGGRRYVFELAAAPVTANADGSFAHAIVRARRLSATTLAISSALAPGEYAWHVRAKNRNGSSPWSSVWTVQVAQPRFQFIRLSDPPRTAVTDAGGNWVATFTDGASTVRLAGPERTFAEASAADPVVSTTWVRVLPAPFDGTVDMDWLNAELIDGSADALQIAMQYVSGALPIYQGDRKIAGDADYGPIGTDGTRQPGSDFNDYLGVPWTYGTLTDNPEPDQINSLDCSGFIRMVWGYRGGMPLSYGPDGVGVPRHAYQIFAEAPGIVVIPNAGTQVTDFSLLAIGDLVFFDASTVDGTQIDHAGIFLGRDTGGRYRFISSRKTLNGPTLGDDGGKALLDGTGLYATSFRGARRL
jgi:hypothetical protein